MATENTYSREKLALSGKEIETERLRLRPFKRSDDNAFWRMRSSAAVMEHIPLDVATDRAAQLQEYADEYAAGERYKFFYAVEWKTPPAKPAHPSDTMIGWVLFRPTEEGDYVELGYWFLPEAWGKGVATEASLGIIHGQRAALGVPLKDVYAETFLENDASRKVLEKVGLELTHQGFKYGKPTNVFHWK
ncbi:MAG: GNAT family N-acetyltransferase [Kordiimonadaceae bacterium]|nr:GNAT family N-acetyltransferase [Kordiimonadaceae bacterium]